MVNVEFTKPFKQVTPKTKQGEYTIAEKPQDKSRIPIRSAIAGGVVFVIVAVFLLLLSVISIATYKFNTYNLSLASVVALPLSYGALLYASAFGLIQSSLKFRANPIEHTKWGLRMLICSILCATPFAYAITIILSLIGPVYDSAVWVTVFMSLFANIGVLAGLGAAVGALRYQPHLVVTKQALGISPTNNQPVDLSICPRCGFVLHENVTVCPDCGNPLT